MADRAPETKRVKISKAQQMTLLEVLIASLILGSCIVLANFLMKYINFNTAVMKAKNDAVAEYDQTIRNVGICEDTDKNKRLDDGELAQCVPNATKITKVVDSLRYNIYQEMAKNENLESVARQRDRDGICYDDDGAVIDFAKLADEAKTDAEREKALSSSKLCSALRVISDALPSYRNTEALLASLNQIYLETNVDVISIKPRDDEITSDITNVGVIPMSFTMAGTGADVIRFLDGVERSIREFDIQTMQVEWREEKLEFSALAYAYYLNMSFNPEVIKRVQATSPEPQLRSTKTSLTEAAAGASSLRGK